MPARRSQQPYQPEQGFTIFEVLIVLVILGMAMTVAPSIMASLNGSRLRAASDELVARLRETRNQALVRGTVTELLLDLRQRSFATSNQASFRPLPGAIDAVDVAPPALVQSSGIARIRFLADGTASDARISLRRGGMSTEIAVEWLTGRVRQGG